MSCLPGPSAVTTALAVAGLPSERFCFEGFAPRKHAARLAWLESLAAEPRTCVFFESPRRLADSLQDAVDALGADRRAVVCRELTKTHEEITAGTLAELAEWAADGVLGEITVVLAGATPQADLPTLVAEVQRLGRRRHAGQGRLCAGGRARIRAPRRGASSTMRFCAHATNGTGGSMSTAMYVASIVTGVLALLALVLIPIIAWLRRRNRAVAEQLATEIAGEAIVRAPEKGSYRGATAPGYPVVKNTRLIALTKRRLVFRTLTGKTIEVPVDTITGVREATVFKGSVVGGQKHLILQTAAGEIGFYVFSGIDGWMAALQQTA